MTDDNDEEIYPCADWGMLRSVNQGAKVFAVCDECWDNHYAREQALEAVRENGR